MSNIDKRIQVNTIIENQLPEFVVSDFPKATEFLKQYFISQEFQGGAADLINNFDQYIKPDNLVPESVVGITSISSAITSTDTIIEVPSTKGFPSEYGLIKIDNEIISYTGITSTSFTGCIRGFSGISGYNVGVSSSLLEINRESLVFEETTASSHIANSNVTNLSVLFLQEFFRKLKATFLPGLENEEFSTDLDIGNFVKFSRSFYQSKGIAESIKILFKVLYGVDSTILDLEGNLIKPSSAEFIRREVIVADLITTTAEPSNLVGQTIFKSTDPATNASVSEVEVLTRGGKTYYKISLFVGFSDRDLIQGVFTVPGRTKSLDAVSVGSSIISVDSTIGFGKTGTLISDGNGQIDYTSKSINQFFGCTNIGVGIGTAEDLRTNETIFGYENGDLTKRVDLRITGVLSELKPVTDINLINEGESIFVKNVGEKITNDRANYKQIFANSWIYNTSTRFQVDISGSTFSFNTLIDKSSLKIGDRFDILKRNEQVIVGGGTVDSIDVGLNQITASNIAGFVPVPFQYYDIRRKIEKAKSSGVTLIEGNDNIIANALNVYVDGNQDGYVASNSLPSYEITTDIVEEVLVGSTQVGLTGFDPLTRNYTTIQFSPPPNTDIQFIQGDAVVYLPDGEALSGLDTGRTYFVDPVVPGPNQNKSKIRLYNSLSQIGSASTIQIGVNNSTTDKHRFVLKQHKNKLLEADKILRKFPLNQNLFISSKQETPVTDIGILINGVQIRSPISDDQIYFGPLESIELLNGGEGYDVINPPAIGIETSSGVAAQAEPIVQGTVKSVFVDPQEFDIEAVTSISLTGANGSGCVLQPVVGERDRFISFDSRNIFFNGGVDVENETITFTSNHNLEDGQLVYYNSNGNTPIGIGSAYDTTNKIVDTLSDGDPYFVRIVNPKTVRLFNTPNDAIFGATGINTVGLSTDTSASGIHRFRTEKKRTLIAVKVLNEGSGYTHRKLRVKPTGISTTNDTINFINHGFSSGEVIEYLGGTTNIGGLTTTTSYLVSKVNDDSFQLADAGVGGTSFANYDRGLFADLQSSGDGFHVFKYPDIKVNINVSYGSTVTGDIIVTPVVTGELLGAYLYEEGTNYGSVTLNKKVEPKIELKNGRNAEFRPIIVDGKIVDVVVVNRGRDYFSSPELIVTSTEAGKGAVVRPVVDDGRIIDAVVTNTGIGYSSLTTEVRAFVRGTRGGFSARVRGLTVNNSNRFGDTILSEKDDSLKFGILGYSQEIASNFENSFVEKQNGEFDRITAHSPIIGWAYDGNPIYGPFGYSIADDINSPLKIIKTSYETNINATQNRPVGYEPGFFVDDHIFNNSGDLDIHNGRFCKTPEFPNGVYAYFTSVGLGTVTNKLEGLYPYFIGNTYRSPFIPENQLLDHDFDFNSTSLRRNTYPHNVDEPDADNDFIVESYEDVRQISKVESVTKGGVDGIEILSGGEGYKVGDFTVFDDKDTNGSGFNAQVSEIVGIGISSIDTQITSFENAVLRWKSSTEVVASFLPFIEVNDQDNLTLSGLSTEIFNLSGTYRVGVSTDRVSLASTMTVGSASGLIQDIFLTDIPKEVSAGSSVRIGSGNTVLTETVEVLNVFPINRALRVRRNVGVAHTSGSNVDFLNTEAILPVRTNKFESFSNEKIYFNGPQSVGIGTTTGSAIKVNRFIGNVSNSVSIPTRTIHIPNHPFVSGQRLTINKKSGALRFDVGRTPNVTEFKLPFVGQNSTEVFVIKKDSNNIGLVTSRVGIGSTSEGLFFYTKGSNTGINSGSYYFESLKEQVTGNLDKILSTVTTNVALANTTTHGLKNKDIVSINVVPNLTVGIGTTTPVTVKYNSNFNKLIVNPLSFTSSNVLENKIGFSTHGFETGDKVFYDGSATGISTGTYFVYKVDSNNFKLVKTIIDLNSDPVRTVSITANTGGNQTIGLINPRINVVKNSLLSFTLKDSSLEGFDFGLYYDQNLTNRYYSSQDSVTFNVGAGGTLGIGTNNFDPVGAALTVQYSKSSPNRLYYGLSKGGFISTADTEVSNYSEIRFVDSEYNGEYQISNVTDNTFDFSPKIPEFLSYVPGQCEKLEYSTKSTSVHGSIKEFKVLSSGFNYKKLPKFVSVNSEAGNNANITPFSSSIGRIKKVRIVDIGYEYSSDKTLSPQAFISPVLSLDNLDEINSVRVVSGGNKYLAPPQLLIYNPQTDTVVDSSSLEALTPNQTVADVNVVSPITGLDSVVHRIIAINNTNGVGINSVQTSASGVVTCFVETPINGYDTPPFAIGDQVYVEGIQRVGETGVGATQGGISTNTTVSGTGYNSDDYQYRTFTVDDYITGTQDILKFNVSGVTTNPGIAKTYQSGYAQLINQKDLPVIQPIQSRGTFDLNEKLVVNNSLTDLKVTEIREEFIKVDGKFRVFVNDRITGELSNTSAEIVTIVNNEGIFETDYSSKQEYGWIDNIGKLNEDVQVLPDNDYYQNLSYSIKSSVDWDKFVNPVNRLVHPSGLKNFADTSILSTTRVGAGNTLDSNQLVVLDVGNILELSDKQRVDAINNFDRARDFDTIENNTKSKFLTFKNRNLTDFTRCLTNRVLVHDDISETFSSEGFESISTVIEPLSDQIANYVIQVVDPDTLDVQFNELVVITTEKDAFLFEKNSDFSNVRLGVYETQILNTGTKNLLFTPDEAFTKDHDIKIIKTSFNTDLVGINTTGIGNVDLTGVNAGISTRATGISTTTFLEIPKNDFNALYASIFVQDSITKEINYNEIIVDFDGVDTTIAESYIDTQPGISNSVVGVITARFENDLIKIQCENDRRNPLELRANVVGLGSTSAGIGTYRFSVAGQPLGAERSARYESGFSTSIGSTITYATINNLTDSSAKSLVRVSCGETSAVHQVITMRDNQDVLTIQYPFVSAGSTTGIGTFGGEISGNNVNLRFYPDAEFDSLIKVQSFNQILYTASDFDNSPPSLTYGTVSQNIFLTTYDGASGLRANKKDFELKFEGVPIYSKTFNPSNEAGLAKSTGIFTIPSHFFNTNEELLYKPESTFIGVAGTAVSIGATTNMAGIVTTLLPSTVFAKVIDENKFQLFTRPEFVNTGAAVTFTGVGGGNAHKLSMTKPLTKTIIGLDGVVQNPINFTTISHNFGVFDGTTYNNTIGIGLSQFVLSGISSIQPTDFLKINEEYMLVTEVGFSSTPTGVINDSTDVSLGIATLPVVKVRRGQLGIAATSHTANDVARVHRGSFNIVDSTVFFANPPKGNSRSRRDETNLPFVRADFSGRTFLRQNYTTNMLFDDISDNFTGIGKTYSLTVGGANTSSGIEVGNGVVFINGVFQTPLTLNNSTGNCYEIFGDTISGISTIQFTGITSTNGDFIVSEFDINQNQVPRGGLIVSLGSTPGTGYAPLVGAKVKPFKDSLGRITSVVGIATSSGFNLGIQTAVYDNVSGIITVTTDKVHGFALERPNTVKLKNLEFSCVGYSGVTTTIFQDHERPLFLVGIVSDRTFEVQAGPSTIVHTYVGGGNAFEFFEDLTFGSGYRGGTVACGVTDQAYVHRFVSSGIGSIRKGNFAATGANAFTATDAVYTSFSGQLVLTIPNHGLSTSDTVGIDTGGLVFKCSKDNFFSDHPYPRAVSKTSFPNSDPIAGIQTAILATTTNTITLNVGAGGGGGTGASVSATVGAGGTLAFTINNPGTGYVNPEIIIPEPNYDNLPVVGVSRIGFGATTDTGKNLLLDVKVSSAKTTVGLGSTAFEISEFSIARPGHSFKVGDKFKPVGLVTAAHLSQPLQEFELEVVEVFNDQFSSWQFGELDFIDSIQNLQDGVKTRFPLFFNGQLLSFEKDLTNPTSQLIDLNAVLLIFVNGVLQKPGISYTFEGGTTFEFEEAPMGESSPGANDQDKVDIFFYKGTQDVDVDTSDIQPQIKVGDEIRVLKDNTGVTTSQQLERTVNEILGAKLVETEIYTGRGIDQDNEKPVRWTKQKVDIILGGKKIDKSREILEPQVYPTSKIIGDFTVTSGIGTLGVVGIFVDDAEVFHYENANIGKPRRLHSESVKNYANYNLTYGSIDALVTPGSINVGASATAIVSAAGTISSINVTNAGSGYNSATVKLAVPTVGVGTYTKADGTIGIGSLATATSQVVNGSVTRIDVVNSGIGYTYTAPPQVIIDLPPFETEKITAISNVQGFTGIITGITTTTGINGHPLAIKFFFRASQEASGLKVDYPVFISNTSVGNGVTSVDGPDTSVVGIGTTFLDNVYKVHAVSTNAENGEITCNVHSGINTDGIFQDGGGFNPAKTGISTEFGRLSWGRLYGVTRSPNPISIGVTGLTVNSGLTTFPTIQRKHYIAASLRGLRSSGAIRVFGIWLRYLYK